MVCAAAAGLRASATIKLPLPGIHVDEEWALCKRLYHLCLVFELYPLNVIYGEGPAIAPRWGVCLLGACLCGLRLPGEGWRLLGAEFLVQQNLVEIQVVVYELAESGLRGLADVLRDSPVNSGKVLLL